MLYLESEIIKKQSKNKDKKEYNLLPCYVKFEGKLTKCCYWVTSNLSEVKGALKYYLFMN